MKVWSLWRRFHGHCWNVGRANQIAESVIVMSQLTISGLGTRVINLEGKHVVDHFKTKISATHHQWDKNRHLGYALLALTHNTPPPLPPSKMLKALRWVMGNDIIKA